MLTCEYYQKFGERQRYFDMHEIQIWYYLVNPLDVQYSLNYAEEVISSMPEKWPIL